MYKNMLLEMNSEYGETPAKKIITQGIEILDTKTDTESHSLLELEMKHQGLYYRYLQIANVKKI